MANDKILDLAKKLKALADRGIGGEQKNAVSKLHALLQKHGLTVQDLEDEKRFPEQFEYKNWEKNILAHIIWKAAGENTKLFGSRLKRNAFIIDCTHAHKIEILAMQDLYRRAFKKELRLFTTAFILKNDLGTSGDGDRPKTNWSLREKMKVINMMKGIDHQASHKQIEQ